MLPGMDEHLDRLLHDIEVAVKFSQPTESSVVRAASTVEAIGNAMEGDIPRGVRERVRRLAYDLERIGFTSDESRLQDLVHEAFALYQYDLQTLATLNE
jgi:hypothetical protein